MVDIKQTAAETYKEKSIIKETDSGIPLKSFYVPEDIEGRDTLSTPGAYPFTRGIYNDMYRGRLWSKRELCGFASPEETNMRIKFLVNSGESAINFIVDLPTMNGIDSDHPRARADIGRQGVPLCTTEDAETIIRDIPLDKVSVNVTTLGLSQPALYVAAVKRAGYHPSVLRGTTVNDCLHFWVCGYHYPSFPLTWGFRCSLDWIEYCMKEIPKFNPLSIDAYDYRENGITAVMEVAFGLASAKEYIKALLARGLDIDNVAPRVGAVTHSSERDFFEEIAKLRAARKIWANMVKEEFKAKSERALKYKFHVHTAGSSLTMQQPLVNVVRIAYQALAAVLAGCQSLATCAYDEAIGLPTEESHELAIRTQQVLAYETGVTAVSDPLGGSYHMEWLTGEIEKKVLEYMEVIETQGGMKKAIETGWVEGQIQETQYLRQKEIEAAKRTVIGLNKYRKPFEEENIPPAHRVPEEQIEKHLEQLKRFRKSRNGKLLSESLENLYNQAKEPDKNLVYPAVEAAEAGATQSEIRGTIRMAYGESFDPFDQIEPTFDASFAAYNQSKQQSVGQG